MFRHATIRALAVLLACAGVHAADEPVRRTPGAEAFRRTIDLAPATALSVIAVPSPKLASDDLSECLARIEGAASAVPLRPLDLLRSQVGIGPGTDDTGPLVVWTESRGGSPVFAALVPVTDPKAFIAGSLQPVEGEPGAFMHPRIGKLHLREMGKHVLVSQNRELVEGHAPAGGLAESIERRLGARGFAVLLSGDAAAWAGPEAMRAIRADAQRTREGLRANRGAPDEADAPMGAAAADAPRPTDPLQRADLDGNGEIDSGDQSLLMLEMGARGENAADLNGDGVVDQADVEQLKAAMGRKVEPRGKAASASTSQPADAAKPAPLEDAVTDGVLAVDLDPLGISVRSYAVLDPSSALGRSARGGPRGGPARLTRLPKGPFMVAAAADLSGLGGGDAFLDLMALVPNAPELPAWVRENRELIRDAQFAIYPSKLGIAGGGLLNEAIVWLGTADAARSRQLLRDWMQGLAGIDGATERKVAWEADKTLKDGQVADAWAITEAPAPKDAAAKPRRAANPMQRMARMMVFGPRGANGFAKAFGDGLMLTFSQRPDVLARGSKAAEGGEALQGQPVIEALQSWLTPDPDVVGYLGIGPLVGAVRQAAAGFPGMSLQLPDIPPGIEPVAFSLEVQDGRVETATMVPTAVIGAIREIYEAATAPPPEEELEP